MAEVVQGVNYSLNKGNAVLHSPLPARLRYYGVLMKIGDPALPLFVVNLIIYKLAQQRPSEE